jgi:hypothetical protein
LAQERHQLASLNSAGLVVRGLGHRRYDLARKSVQFRGHVDMALVEKRPNG